MMRNIYIAVHWSWDKLMVKDVDMVELATENIPIIENRRRRRG